MDASGRIYAYTPLLWEPNPLKMYGGEPPKKKSVMHSIFPGEEREGAIGIHRLVTFKVNAYSEKDWYGGHKHAVFRNS